MTHEFAKYPDGTMGVFSVLEKEKMEKNIFALLLKDQKTMDLIHFRLNFQVIKLY